MTDVTIEINKRCALVEPNITTRCSQKVCLKCVVVDSCRFGFLCVVVVSVAYWLASMTVSGCLCCQSRHPKCLTHLAAYLREIVQLIEICCFMYIIVGNCHLMKRYMLCVNRHRHSVYMSVFALSVHITPLSRGASQAQHLHPPAIISFQHQHAPAVISSQNHHAPAVITCLHLCHACCLGFIMPCSLSKVCRQIGNDVNALWRHVQ